MSNKPSFAVDAMLGNIAKKLRLLGFDTFYSSNIEDDELLNKAKIESRVIITKDEQLSQTAENMKILNVKITSTSEIEQILQINNVSSLGKCVISGGTSRCSVCNGILYKTEKSLVSEKVPKGVLENTENFWTCNNCKKIYWEGSHIKKLQQFVVSLNERL